MIPNVNYGLWVDEDTSMQLYQWCQIHCSRGMERAGEAGRLGGYGEGLLDYSDDRLATKLQFVKNLQCLQSTIRWSIVDVPGGPVAKTPCSQCRGSGFHLSSGN